MPGFVRSDVRAQLIHQTRETFGGFVSEVGGDGSSELSWKERYFVYVIALLGFLFFLLVKNSSANFAETRKKVLRDVASLNAVKVDEENWQSYIPSSFQ